MTLTFPTNYDLDIFNGVYKLFMDNWDRRPVRSVGVSITNLQQDEEYQIDLFNDYLPKENLNIAIDKVWNKYGRTALFRASSLTKAGQATERAKKIGGHYK